MVKLLVCNECMKEAKRTNHIDLYSTGASIIFGCKHSIEELKREVSKEASLLEGVRGRKRRGLRRGKGIEVVKQTKIEFRDGKFVIKGEPVPLKDESLQEFMGW